VIQSTLPRKDVVQSATAILHRIDASLAFSKVNTMRELVSEASARRRFQTCCLSIFAVMATTLALIGFYGLLAYIRESARPGDGDTHRTWRQPWRILRLFLGQAFASLPWGWFLGLARHLR